MSSPRRTTLIAVLAISSPVSLGAETLIRKALFTADMREMRALLNPFLTPVAWVLLAVTSVAALAGVPAHRAVHRRLVDKLGERRSDPVACASTDTMALYIASSVVQFPTLAATMTFTMGADLVPVFAALWVAAFAVVAMGVFGAKPLVASLPAK